MLEAGEDLGLQAEATQRAADAEFGAQDFQRDGALRLQLPGFVDRAHAALGDEAHDPEAGNAAARVELRPARRGER